MLVRILLFVLQISVFFYFLLILDKALVLFLCVTCFLIQLVVVIINWIFFEILRYVYNLVSVSRMSLNFVINLIVVPDPIWNAVICSLMWDLAHRHWRPVIGWPLLPRLIVCNAFLLLTLILVNVPIKYIFNVFSIHVFHGVCDQCAYRVLPQRFVLTQIFYLHFRRWCVLAAFNKIVLLN